MGACDDWHYLTEIPLGGIRSSQFNCREGRYDEYASEIIRNGNCVCLLDVTLSLTESTFWVPNHFEFISKYVFLTFNKSFLLRLIEEAELQRMSSLKRCRELLLANPVAYNGHVPDNADEELKYCYLRMPELRKDRVFDQMFELDTENRRALLDAVEKRIAEFPKPIAHLDNDPVKPADHALPKLTGEQLQFLNVLVPIDGSAEITLQYIIDSTNAAGFKFQIFRSVQCLKNGKNEYGLNGCITAMIDFFYQNGYFKNHYDLKEIVKAFLRYSGNKIGKLHSYLSEFREDKSYISHYAKLKALKIKKLSGKFSNP